MNREEAKNQVYSFVHDDSIESIQEFIDLIYNSIDAKRCENCKEYYSKPGYCEFLGINVDADFGCRDFVKKGKK